MPSAAHVIRVVRDAFAATPHPGDAFLVGSSEGCEPEESIAPLRGVARWSDVPAETLDAGYTALSFLSDGGFRFFLPAYVVADLEDRLRTADPVLHLAAPFSRTSVEVPAGRAVHRRESGGDVLLNPRRYGAITFEDHARLRLSAFCREEAQALVAYLNHRREQSTLALERDGIDAALERFWNGRASGAPARADLEAHLAREEAYLRAITGGGGA